MCPVPPAEHSCLVSGNGSQHYNDSSCWRTFICRESGQQQVVDSINARDAGAGPRKHNSWYAILFGQAIALALSCANAASSTLENKYQIKVPTFLTGIVYFLLSFHLVHLFWKHRTKEQKGNGCYEMIEEVPTNEQQEPDVMQQMPIELADSASSSSEINTQPSHIFPFTTLPIHAAWYSYLLLAILDVEANYLAMLSFQHTSLSSSMLLTSLSVLSTVLLRSMIFTGASYGRRRLLGVFFCLLGGCLWLREDGASASPARYLDGDLASEGHMTKHQTQMQILYGDFLALLAACLYGLNDVLAEYFVKTNNDGGVEYLGMIGFFGSVWSFFIQVPLLEKTGVQKLIAGVLGMDGDITADNDSSNLMMGAMPVLLCFVILLSSFYKSVMSFLSKYDSTILNLSLQSCPLWAVVLTMAQENSGRIAIPPAIFFVSLALVVSGMFLYESDSRNDDDNRAMDETDHGSIAKSRHHINNNAEIA